MFAAADSLGKDVAIPGKTWYLASAGRKSFDGKRDNPKVDGNLHNHIMHFLTMISITQECTNHIPYWRPTNPSFWVRHACHSKGGGELSNAHNSRIPPGLRSRFDSSSKGYSSDGISDFLKIFRKFSEDLGFWEENLET